MFLPDGSHGVVYNGEVYNYKELRSELEGAWDLLSNQNAIRRLCYGPWRLGGTGHLPVSMECGR